MKTRSAYEDFLKTYAIGFPTYRYPAKVQLARITALPCIRKPTSSTAMALDRKIVGPQDWSSPEMIAYLDSLLNEK